MNACNTKTVRHNEISLQCFLIANLMFFHKIKFKKILDKFFYFFQKSRFFLIITRSHFEVSVVDSTAKDAPFLSPNTYLKTKKNKKYVKFCYDQPFSSYRQLKITIEVFFVLGPFKILSGHSSKIFFS